MLRLFTRRNFLRASGLGLLGITGGLAIQEPSSTMPGHAPRSLTDHAADKGQNDYKMVMPAVQGEVDHIRNGFSPTDILTDFDYGKVSTLPSGQTLHEYDFVAQAKDLELAPGVTYPAWTYNGRVPGPTIRAREGDRIRINFTNATSHLHSIHLHSIHPAEMDGVFEQVEPGGRFVYQVDAEPAGVHLYHCHTSPQADSARRRRTVHAAHRLQWSGPWYAGVVRHGDVDQIGQEWRCIAFQLALLPPLRPALRPGGRSVITPAHRSGEDEACSLGWGDEVALAVRTANLQLYLAPSGKGRDRDPLAETRRLAALAAITSHRRVLF